MSLIKKRQTLFGFAYFICFIAFASNSHADVGVSRDVFIDKFTPIGFSFEKGSDVKGAENWVGNGKDSVIQLIGPKKDLGEVSLMQAFDQDKERNLHKFIVAMSFVNIVVPSWDVKEMRAWLAQAIKEQGGKEIRDGKEISMTVVKEMGMTTITISPVH
ncbi:hypothetical protein [Pararhodospirillum photometricum]|uniref:hypothetical protein n=1 Tax=Pararhodospirillum photometricum TaxID=1084 RepID=UPI0002F8E44D|nr:hypothetical protein [Pararhodospirillum photometricum]